MDYISIMYFAVIVVLVLFIVGRLAPASIPGSSRNLENFDTYGNFTMAAQRQFALTPVGPKDFTEAERLAKYVWNEKVPEDIHGLRIYGKYYDELIQNNNYPVEDPTYVERGLQQDGYIDSRFELQKGTEYDLKGMADPDPVYTQANGMTIVLSQKNF